MLRGKNCAVCRLNGAVFSQHCPILAAGSVPGSNLCCTSQTALVRRRSLLLMSAKYYTQFILTDAQYRGGNEFSGVVELSHPMEENSDKRDIEAVLAKNFDLAKSAVKLVSWSRLH